MYYHQYLNNWRHQLVSASWQTVVIFLLGLMLFINVFAQDHPESIGKQDVVIDQVKDGEIFIFGKNVLIKNEVKGVLVFGGDAIIEGNVTEDVAVFGGSIYQKENASIGGDVIIFGGKYIHDRSEPLRAADKETIILAGYEEELRNMTSNPAQLLSPRISWSYFGQRLLSLGFWFVVALLFTTIAPGAVSRAVARFHLSTARIIGLGLLVFIGMTILIFVGLRVLPSSLSGVIGLMLFFLAFLAYVFGRVALQVSFGKLFQRRFFKPDTSEVAILFIGSFVMTILLSIPYFWSLAVILLFSTGIGLVISSRKVLDWKIN